MALLAQQAFPIAAYFPSTCSSVDYDSGSLDYTPPCSTFLPLAWSGMIGSGLTNSVWTASQYRRSRLRAIIRRQPARTECSSRGYNGNFSGNCRDNFSQRAVPLPSSFQGFQLLQLCLPMDFLAGPKFGFSCGRVVTKLPTCRLSWNVRAKVNGSPKRHWIGVLGMSGQEPRRRKRTRASRENGSGSSEEADEDRETLQELTQEVGEAQGSEDNDSERTDERLDAGRQESPIESGKGSGEEEAEDNETVSQSEKVKTGFWRKIWEPGQKEEDVSLDPEEELLLKDLESLSLNWKALLDPSWDNVLALCFTVLLTIALFKILFQLVLVAITILLSALKYSVLAAFLLGLLIFLL